MSQTIKLIYFDLQGAAETTRYLFKYGDIEFEDVRFKHEEWPQWKEKAPFGKVPLLEYDGKLIDQSVSIARFAAKQVKLAGNDDWENLEIDAIVDTMNDLRLKLMTIHHESDEAKKAVLRETHTNETLPLYLSRLEALVQKNDGHLAVRRLTWADFYFTTTISTLVDFVCGVEIIPKYSNLNILREKVNFLPAIKKWIAERPKTKF